MIFELLDAKRKRIATVTDTNLVGGSLNRDLDDRFVKDSLEAEFTLNMKEELDKAKYVMVSDTGYLRGNPVYRVYQKETIDTINIVATSYTTEDLGGYLVNTGELRSVTEINTAFNKSGFKLELEGVTITEEVIQSLNTQLSGEEVEIGTVLKELMLILDVYGEFTFEVNGDEVDEVGIRLTKQLGRTVNRGLVYGVNIDNLRIDERVEDIITAVDYTGMEFIDSYGEVEGYLTLQGARNIELPKTKRSVVVNKYTDVNGEEMYILEDSNATKQYGTFNNETGEMHPKIERYSDTNINSLEDLVREAVVKLDGRSVPKTQYNIRASVNGLDVGDLVEVQIPHIKVDRYLDVLSVSYNFNREGKVTVTVGEHLPTELDRRFENIPTAKEQKEENESGGRGAIRNEIIQPISAVVYTGVGLSNGRVKFVITTKDVIKPREYDYYIDFDYKIDERYKNAKVMVGIGGGGELTRTVSNNRGVNNVNIIELGDVNLDGTTGTVEIRLNDFYNFMNLKKVTDEGDYNTNITNILINPYQGLMINRDSQIRILLTVETESGNRETLFDLDVNKFTPVSSVGLKFLSGYLTNFTLTEHER